MNDRDLRYRFNLLRLIIIPLAASWFVYGVIVGMAIAK